MGVTRRNMFGRIEKETDPATLDVIAPMTIFCIILWMFNEHEKSYNQN